MEKKYSVNMENDEVVSVEVDGVQYASPEDIPDEQDREKIALLISRSIGEGFDDAFDENFDKEFEEEFREMEKKSAVFPKIIVGIFLGISVIMLIIAAISAFGAARSQSREQSAPGQVVDMVMRTSRDSSTQQVNEYYYPVVEFAVPGRALQRVQLSEGSWPPAYETGDRVTVLYDPQQPRNARIKSFSSTLLLWLLPGITGTVGAAFLIVSLAVFRLASPSKKDPSAGQAVMEPSKS
jgi:hypothetical protein